MEVRGAVVVGWGPGADLVGSFEFFEDAEGYEGDDALAVGGMFPDLDAVVGAILAVDAVEVRALAFVDVLPAEFEGDGVDFFAAVVHVVF